eukprot:21105-Heterococcus_DN1.PRE.4
MNSRHVAAVDRSAKPFIVSAKGLGGNLITYVQMQWYDECKREVEYIRTLASMQCDNNDGTFECTNLVNDAVEGRCRALVAAIAAAGAAFAAVLGCSVGEHEWNVT